MFVIYAIIILALLFFTPKIWRFVEKKFNEIDKEDRTDAVADKMDDLKSNEKTASEIKKFKEEHKDADKAGEEIEEFIKK